MLNRSPLPVPASTSWRSQLSHISSRPGRGSTVTKRVVARRGGHHQRQARVLEADRARARGHLDIKSAGNDAVRVDVSTVLPTGFQQIDPQAVELAACGRGRTRIPWRRPRRGGSAACASRRTPGRASAGRSARRSWCSRRSDAPSTSAVPPRRHRRAPGSSARARPAAAHRRARPRRAGWRTVRESFAGRPLRRPKG